MKTRVNTILFLYFVGMFTISFFLLSGCAKQPTPETNQPEIIKSDENVTVYSMSIEAYERSVRRKKKFLVRGCCEYYNFRLGKVILCSTNNGNCQWCYNEVCNNDHPKD